MTHDWHIQNLTMMHPHDEEDPAHDVTIGQERFSHVIYQAPCSIIPCVWVCRNGSEYTGVLRVNNPRVYVKHARGHI